MGGAILILTVSMTFRRDVGRSRSAGACINFSHGPIVTESRAWAELAWLSWGAPWAWADS